MYGVWKRVEEEKYFIPLRKADRKMKNWGVKMGEFLGTMVQGNGEEMGMVSEEIIKQAILREYSMEVERTELHEGKVGFDVKSVIVPIFTLL
jgi:hypothetical protein